MLLWYDRGADSVAEWFKFPAPALLLSRISLPDGAAGPLQQLELHVCCAHSRSLRVCPERVHRMLNALRVKLTRVNTCARLGL